MAKRKSDGSLCEEKVAKTTSGEAFESDYSVEWKIKNFRMIKSSKDLIAEQQHNFVVGESHGYPTKWRCYLHEKPETDGIVIRLRMTEVPPKFRAVVKFLFQTIKPNGGIHKTELAKAEVIADRKGRGFRMIPRNEEELEELIWEDGSIVIRVTLKVFLFKRVIQPNELDVEKEVDWLEKRQLQKLSLFMSRMIELDTEPELGKIIKVVSKDQAQFYANTAILSDSSPVFEAMFAGNWKEGQDSSGRDGGGNSLVLKDLNGKTVRVLLHFLMGGVLLKEEWKGEDVILELTNAAGKYQLEGLIEFLDKVLPGLTVSTEVLGKLALLTKRLGMENAEERLFSKLKETVTDIEQLVLDKEGSLLGDN